jgi:hypothetical protein
VMVELLKLQMHSKQTHLSQNLIYMVLIQPVTISLIYIGNDIGDSGATEIAYALKTLSINELSLDGY